MERVTGGGGDTVKRGGQDEEWSGGKKGSRNEGRGVMATDDFPSHTLFSPLVLVLGGLEDHSKVHPIPSCLLRAFSVIVIHFADVFNGATTGESRTPQTTAKKSI